MERILRLEDGRKLALYTAGDRIFYLMIPIPVSAGNGLFYPGHLAVPRVLADHYGGKLDCCMSGSQVCFAYLDSQGMPVYGSFVPGRHKTGMKLPADSMSEGAFVAELALLDSLQEPAVLWIEEAPSSMRRLYLKSMDRESRTFQVAQGGPGLGFETARKEHCVFTVVEDSRPVGRFSWDGKQCTEIPGWNREEEIRTLCLSYEEKLRQTGRQYEELAQITRQLQDAGKKLRNSLLT